MAAYLHGELVRFGQNLATAAILALGDDRQLILRGGNTATHVVVDVTAYIG